MFVYFAALLSYALLSFGAVLPHSWLAIAILWIAGFAAVIASRVLRGQPAAAEAAAMAAGIAVLLLVGAKPSIAVFAGGWVWAASARGDGRVLRFLNILIAIGILEALLGMFQFFAAPGWIFGYVTSSRSSGTLINRNHFAGLIGMIVPLSLGYAYIGMRRFGDLARSYVYLLTGAFVATALIFSLSRSGIFSFVMTMLLLAVLVGLKDSRARLAAGLALGMLAMVTAVALWIGIDIVVERYSKFFEEGGSVREGRGYVYRDTLQMIRTHPWGIGYGNYRDVFRQYQTFQPGLLFDHAHNDYLETAAELGIAAAAALWGAVGWILMRMIRAFRATHSPERSGILLGCIGSVTGMLIHSLTDFNLQIPSNAMLFFALLGLGLRYASTPGPAREEAR